MKRKSNHSKFNKMINDFKYYNRVGKKYQAKNLLDTLIREYPNDHRVKFEQALYLYKNNSASNADKALDLLEDLIEEDAPNKFSCMYEYVKVSIYSTNISDKTLQYLNILKNRGQKLEYIEFYYGKYYERRKNYDMALKHYKISSNLGFDKSKKAVDKITMKMHPSNRKVKEINDVHKEEITTLDQLYIKCRVLLTENRISEMYELLKKSEKLIKVEYMNSSNLFCIFNKYLDISKVEDARRLYLKYNNCLNTEWERKYFEGRINLCTGNYEQAIKDFKYIIECNQDYVIDAYYYLSKIAYMNNNSEYEKQCYDNMLYLKKYEMAKVYIVEYYLRNNDKEKAIECYKSIDQNFKNSNLTNVRQLNAMLGLPLNDKDREFYAIRQIENYDIDSAVDHILRHKEKNHGFGYFNENVDVKDLLLDIRPKIIDRRPDYTDTFDHHILKYNDIGRYDSDHIDFVEVISVPNTNNVITMYPVASNNIFATNYSIEQHNQKVLKRKSQIEKFYAKYGNIK